MSILKYPVFSLDVLCALSLTFRQLPEESTPSQVVFDHLQLNCAICDDKTRMNDFRTFSVDILLWSPEL